MDQSDMMSWQPEAGTSMVMPLFPVPAEDPPASNTADPPTKATGKKKSKAKAKEGEGGATTTTKKKRAPKGEKKVGSNAKDKNQVIGGGQITDHPEIMSATGSRAGSMVPGQTAMDGNNTPTKKRQSTRGKGKKRGSTRAESKGSRATSARASMSVVPGQQYAVNTTQGEEEFAAAEREEEEEEEAEEEVVEEDEEEGDEEIGGQGLEEDEWQRQEAIQKARSTAMGPLMKAMDDVQQDRYAVYRQSFLHKNTIKRLISHLTSQNPTNQVVSITAAMGKVFIGEIVESARKIQQEKGGTGPLQPEYLLAAHRLYKEEREVPGRYPPGAPSASAGTGGNGKRRRLF